MPNYDSIASLCIEFDDGAELNPKPEYSEADWGSQENYDSYKQAVAFLETPRPAHMASEYIKKYDAYSERLATDADAHLSGGSM